MVRKYSVWLPSQYQAPVTGLELLIWSDFSTAALLVTGELNVMRMGIPTP